MADGGINSPSVPTHPPTAFAPSLMTEVIPPEAYVETKVGSTAGAVVAHTEYPGGFHGTLTGIAAAAIRTISNLRPGRLELRFYDEAAIPAGTPDNIVFGINDTAPANNDFTHLWMTSKNSERTITIRPGQSTISFIAVVGSVKTMGLSWSLKF